LATID